MPVDSSGTTTKELLTQSGIEGIEDNIVPAVLALAPCPSGKLDFDARMTHIVRHTCSPSFSFWATRQ
jgi:hypothetical protein